MIFSFSCEETQALFEQRLPSSGRFRRIPADVLRLARRKLNFLHAATRLEDMRSPPGNRLEALRGDRAGQHSVRVNDKYRLCFRWSEGNAYDVEIVDYH